MHRFRAGCLHDYSRNIFQFFKTWLEYFWGKNFAHVGSYVSQVIKYAHNGLESDFDIFGIPEVIEIW